MSNRPLTRRKWFPNSTGREVPLPGRLGIMPPPSPLPRRQWFPSSFSPTFGLKSGVNPRPPSHPY